MSAARPGNLGATRVCPHCKATVLENSAVCPGCRHHLRFNTGSSAHTVAEEGYCALDVDGNFRIDAGARLEGQVKASVVVVGGELQGNIDAAKHVDVLSSGVIVGDVKAASITVAAGSRMRGHVEFGWDDKHNTSLKGATRQV